MDQSFSFGLKTYRSYFQQPTTKLYFFAGGITALVGANNSGKSSLIRAIYELQNYFGYVGNGSWQSDNQITFITQKQPIGQAFVGVSEPLDVVPQVLIEKNKLIEFEITTKRWTLLYILSGDNLEYHQQKITLIDTALVNLAAATEEAISIGRLLQSSQFLGPYRNISNLSTTGGATHYGLPIGDAFIQQWNSLKNGTSGAARRAVIKTQQDIAQLLGYQSLEINASTDNRTLLLVFDGIQTITLSDVGAGIAQLIFSMVSVANRKPQIILIDEPELHLHPTMQARFVEALHRHAGFSTIFATHSVGLARQVANNIFLVSQDKNSGKSSITPFELAKNNAQLLGELSYSQFSAIGGKFLLLVEGTTEVKTFRVLLRKLNIETDVMIIPLGGSALIGANRECELMEFQRTGAEIFVIVDSERTAESEPLSDERENFRITCQKLFGGNRVLLTKRRATENYMSDTAIKAVKSEKYRALSEYEKLEDVVPAWAKSENWKIADEMSFDEIRNTDLGQFLILLQASIQK